MKCYSVYLALLRAKICPECGIWPPEHLDLNKKAKMPSYASSSLSLFLLPEGLHCLFQLLHPLYQVIGHKKICMACMQLCTIR